VGPRPRQLAARLRWVRLDELSLRLAGGGRRAVHPAARPTTSRASLRPSFTGRASMTAHHVFSEEGHALRCLGEQPLPVAAS